MLSGKTYPKEKCSNQFQGLAIVVIPFVIWPLYFFSGFCKIDMEHIGSIFAITYIVTFAILACSKLKFPFFNGYWVAIIMILFGGASMILANTSRGSIEIKNNDLCIQVVTKPNSTDNIYLEFLDDQTGYIKNKKYPINSVSAFEDEAKNYFNLSRNKITQENPSRFHVIQGDRVIFTGIIEEKSESMLVPNMYYTFFCSLQ